MQNLKWLPMLAVVLVAQSAVAQSTVDDYDVWVGREALISVAQGQARKTDPLSAPAYLFVEAPTAESTVIIQNMMEFKGQAFVKIRDTRMVRVTVTAPGMKTVDGYLELTEDEVVKFKVAYTKPETGPRGRDSLVTTPIGAQVYLAGQPVGQTPLTLHNLAPGMHQMAMTFGNWTWQENVAVAGGKTKLIEIEVGAASSPAPRAAAPAPVVRTPPPPAPAPVVVAPPPAPVVVAPPPPAPVVVAPPPAPAPEPEPAPAPARRVKGADCEKVCSKFVQAVDSAGMRDPIKTLCHRRCDAGDIEFSKCAWQAKSMADVQRCGALPEVN